MFIIDDIINAIGSSIAAGQQEKAARDAMGVQKDIWGQQQRQQEPWMQAGRTTLADLLSQMQGGGFNTTVNPQNLANDPGFQFRMAEGQKALERSASARGMLGSGGALKSLARYSQGLASDEYGNAWNRQHAENNARFGRMSNIAGMGQNAATTLGQFGGQYGANMGNLYGALGNAQAAGTMGITKGISGAVGSLGGMALGGIGPGGWSLGNLAGNAMGGQTLADLIPRQRG